jgi:RHS repeat-associated protein
LATEIQGSLQTSVFQHDDQLLAQQRQQDGSVDTTLLATDQQRSVLGTRGLTGSHFLAYSPYGHRPAENGLLSLLGFNGERPDPLTGHYHLGNGYRQFNPVLMRFNSPDSWSPFGRGGLNSYAYSGGDPRNWLDSSGHAPTAVSLEITKFQAKLALNRTSNTASKLPATGVSPATQRSLSSNANRASKPKTARNSPDYQQNRRAAIKELTSTIKANEASTSNLNKYNVSNDITDIATSTAGYQNAKKAYKFEELPDHEIKHTWIDKNNEELLDVAHFDITISHHRNLTQHQKNRHLYYRAHSKLYRTKILRAMYIKKHTGIDLMKIRQDI